MHVPIQEINLMILFIAGTCEAQKGFDFFKQYTMDKCGCQPVKPALTALLN